MRPQVMFYVKKKKYNIILEVRPLNRLRSQELIKILV